MKVASYETDIFFEHFPLTRELAAPGSRCEEHENDLGETSQVFKFEKIK